jgi:hypothetical protein
MKFAIAFLSLVSSALAYQVTYPAAGTIWTKDGPNKFTWNRVETDSTNFTLLLTNQNRNVMPDDNAVLAALVDGTLGSFPVNAPSTGFPVGDGFRLNLVKSTEERTTIYAQSPEFAIRPSNTTSSSATSTRVNTATGVTTVNPIGSSSASNANSGSNTNSASVPENSQTPGNGASAASVKGGVLGAALVGAIACLF